MTTTPEQLLEARQREAIRRLNDACGCEAYHWPKYVNNSSVNVAVELLTEMNWQPPLDPDLAEAIECAVLAQEAAGCPGNAAKFRAGDWNSSALVQSVLIYQQRQRERGE